MIEQYKQKFAEINTDSSDGIDFEEFSAFVMKNWEENQKNQTFYIAPSKAIHICTHVATESINRASVELCGN